MTDLCDYGCGTEAKYKLKNRKNCCCKSTSSCDGMKEINRSKIKNLRKDLGNNYCKNGHPKGSSNGTSLKGKTYDEISIPSQYTQETCAFFDRIYVFFSERKYEDTI
jgi:hypothetical protein